MNNITLKLHKCKTDCYIGEIEIPFKLSNPNNNNFEYELIIILDQSGSMGDNVQKMITQVFPELLTKLKIPNNKKINLILFETKTRLIEMNIYDLKNSQEWEEGGTSMKEIFNYIQKVMDKHPNQKYYRILTVSDGEIWDKKETLTNASSFAEKIKGKYFINSQAIRLFTSDEQPDTTALCTVLQLNNINNAKLIDIDANLNSKVIANRIFELFHNDGLNRSLFLKSEKQKFRESPWGEELNKVLLSSGNNILFFDKFNFETNNEDEFQLIFNDNTKLKDAKIKIEISNDINTYNYQKILENKINTFMNKIKILKIVNTNDSKEEMEKIISTFQKFESSNFIKEENLMEVEYDNKLSTRIQIIKNLVKKKTTTVYEKMRQIQNDEKINELNNLQKAEFLRQMDFNKNTKNLSKRAFNLDTNYDLVIHNEIKEIANHFDELKDIKNDDLSQSFYSTATTLEGLEELVNLSKDELFDAIPWKDLLKVINIVGIAIYGKINDYPDPSIYKPNKIFPGCYISLSDIITVNEHTMNKENLKPPGNLKDEINNCIPIFENDILHKFLIKYAPSILEYLASIGMRRLLLEIPYTYENTIISGIWIMINQLSKNQSEIYCKSFKDIINSMNVVADDHFLNIIDIIKKNEIIELNPNNSVFLNNYNLQNLLYPIYKLTKNDEFKPEIIQKILRSLYQNEIYNYIKIMVKNKSKEIEQNKFLENKIFDLTNLNLDKIIPKTELYKKVDQFKIENVEFEINKMNLKEMCKPIYYLDIISMIYVLFKLSSYDNFKDEIKNLTFNEESYKQNFGINYDMETFRFFNICQALFYFNKNLRQNDLEQKMKIIDLKDYDNSMEQLKKDIKNLCGKDFHKKYKNLLKKQNELCFDELSDKLMNSETMEEFNNLMINGLKKGDFTYKIEKETSLGFYKLKKKLLDLTNNYPLKTKKILYLIQNKKENDNEIKWNNGNPLRNNLKDFEIYLEKVKNEESNLPEIIEVLKNLKKQNYSYREKENRHGHSNSKKSFWAFGYKSLNEIKEKDIDFYNTYINLHKNCCGLEKQNNVKSINQLKKEAHKRKRREWKKNNIANKKIEKKNNEENMPKKQLGLKKQRNKRNRRGKK